MTQCSSQRMTITLIIMAAYISENNFYAEGGGIMHATRRVCMISIGTQKSDRGLVVIYGNVSVTK